jgi:hypothetical protein
VVALGMMLRSVEIASEYNMGYGTTAQHARVTMDRIDRAVSQANSIYSSSPKEDYAGTWTTEDVIGNYNFPDTLIVWRPPASGTLADSQGIPASELVIFCPDPTTPNRLLEVTVPNDTRKALPPPNGTASAFKSFIDGLKTESGVNQILLTDLVYTATISGSASPKAAVRFVVTMNPSSSDWRLYSPQPGDPPATKAFTDLPWSQSICSPNCGLRQVWVRTEIQLKPAGTWTVTSAAAETPVPYFGSSAYCYEITSP